MAIDFEIGALFGGVSYSAVSKTYQRMVEKLQTDRALRKEIEKIDSPISNVNRLLKNSDYRHCEQSEAISF